AWLDMFCALKGATRTPRRARARHSDATTVDLPEPLVVPTTITAPRVVEERLAAASPAMRPSLFRAPASGRAPRVSRAPGRASALLAARRVGDPACHAERPQCARSARPGALGRVTIPPGQAVVHGSGREAARGRAPRSGGGREAR